MSKNAAIKFVPPEVHVVEGFPMTAPEFAELARLLERETGIALSDRKQSLLQARLNRRLRTLQMENYGQYIEFLANGSNTAELEVFVNSLTTNKTEFFREADHFDTLRTWVGKQHQPRLFVWSAACSTGEEVYTLAIVCEELRRSGCLQDYRILGTDIDTECLDEAENAIYPVAALQTVPPQHTPQHFSRLTGRQQAVVQVNDELRSHVKFRQHNLTDPAMTIPLQFDVIFLRNVLIYFSAATINQVIGKMWAHLKPRGLLFLGHSESLGSGRHKFRPVGTSVYEKEP